MLTLEVSDQALRQSTLREGQNVAVLVAMETELELHRFRGRVNLEEQLETSLNRQGINLSGDERQKFFGIVKDSLMEAAPVNQFSSFIGNIMASRISSIWGFSGPAFTLSAEENSVTRALETAQILLANGNVEAVVVSAVDLSGSPEKLLLQQELTNQGTHAPCPWGPHQTVSCLPA